MKSYVIIGLGRFGTALALKLQELGNEVMVIDENAEQVQKLSNRVTYAVVGDARDEEVLTSLGVRNVDCAVVAVGSDLAASILITLNLKALDVPMVICKAPDDLQKRALEKVGADRVVIPERELAAKMAQNLSSSSVLDYIELSSECGIIEMKPPVAWKGKTIRDLNIRAKYGVNVIAMRNGSGQITVAPGPDYAIQEQDIMVILGSSDELHLVQKL